MITQSETGLYADVAGMALIFSWLNVLYENLSLRSVRLKTLCGARTRALHGRNGDSRTENRCDPPVEGSTPLGTAFGDRGKRMAEEKAQEGNTTYFSEFSSDELDAKLKRKDEDGRTLLHIAAAAGTRPRRCAKEDLPSPTVIGGAHPSNRRPRRR